MKFGIELEFFVKKGSKVIPAYLATNNLDGNPVVGEIRTGIFDNFVDVVFDLKRRIFLEEKALKAKGFKMAIIPEIKVTDDFIVGLRKDPRYVNNKESSVLEERSIYGKGVGQVLPKGVYKASLQVNISSNFEIAHNYLDEKGQKQTFRRNISDVFDYYAEIAKLDALFEAEIKSTQRVPGVYAIKDGALGKRVEYRSLPNNVNLMHFIK